jgi:hypothetical protein
MRHGFISRVHARLLLEKYGRVAHIKCEPWIDVNIDTQPLTDEHFNKPLKSLSIMSGHASIQASATSYVHSHDAILHHGDRPTTLDRITETAFAEILGEKYRTYRARAKSRIENIEHVKRRTRFSDLSSVGYTAFDIDKVNLKFSNKTQNVKPSVVEQIFHQVAIVNNPSKLRPLSFGLSEEVFGKISQRAIRLEQASGFEDYLIINLMTHSQSEQIAQGSRVSTAQHTRIRAFLEKIDDKAVHWKEEELALINKASEVWKANYCPRVREIKMVHSSDATTFKNLMELLDIDMTVDGLAGKENKTHKIQTRMSKKKQREKILPLIPYTVDFTTNKSSSPSIQNEKELHKALFCLFVWSTVVGDFDV